MPSCSRRNLETLLAGRRAVLPGVRRGEPLGCLHHERKILGVLQDVADDSSGFPFHRRSHVLDFAWLSTERGTQGIHMSTRIERLRAALETSLHPTLLEIRDDS